LGVPADSGARGAAPQHTVSVADRTRRDLRFSAANRRSSEARRRGAPAVASPSHRDAVFILSAAFWLW